MPRTALLIILFCLSGVRASAGAATCWLDRGAIVVAARFGDITGDFVLNLSQPDSRLSDTVAQAHDFTGDKATSDLTFAGRRLRRFTFAIESLDAQAQDMPTTINGVLGADALRGQSVSISLAPCRISLTAKPSAGALKVLWKDGRPLVAATISDGSLTREGWFRLDTSRPETLIADAALSRPGGHGPVRLRALTIAGRRSEQIPAGLLEAAPEGIQGSIGTAAWRDAPLILDLRQAPIPTAAGRPVGRAGWRRFRR